MKKLLVLIMGITLAFALAACGSKDNTTAPATAASAAPAAGDTGGQTITLKATNFKYDQTEYHVKKGQPVTITLDSVQGMHGAAIKEFGMDLKKSGDTKTFTPDKAGSYTIQCSVMCGAGHTNMKATLIVD
jgi:cytochrome c oxidase subunit 2